MGRVLGASQAARRGVGLERPRFGLAAALGLLAAAAACWPSWPGFMSYDSLFAYRESLEGISTAVWPPVQAYCFWLSRQAGSGVAGYFYAQAAVLLGGAALLFSMFFRGALAVVMAFAAFCGLFVLFPTLWGTLAVLWKDVTTTSFAVLGAALWLVALRARSFAWFAAAALAVCVSVALRYNALPLTAPLLLAMAMVPLDPWTRRARWPQAAVVLGCLALAYGSVTWRLPDFARLPAARGFAGVQMFDLMGVSVCAGENVLPPGMSRGAAITVAEIGALYDPRHVQLAFVPKPGVPVLYETDAGGAVQRAWADTVPTHPGCYLRHRAAVFSQQMGAAAGTVFYPTHGQIDANPYGIALSHPRAAARFVAAVAQGAGQGWRRPWLLYALALPLAGFALVRDGRGRDGRGLDGRGLGRRGRMVSAALLLGAFAYPATLFFVGPAADARYIFPSNVFCALLIVLSAPALITGGIARGARAE